MRQLLIAFSLVVIVMLPSSLRSQTPSGATYEVYALSYGIYPNFPVSALLAGADKDRKIDLQMMVLAWRRFSEKNNPHITQITQIRENAH